MNIPFVSQRVQKYWAEYEWSNIWAMFRNSRIPPKVCSNACRGKLVIITGATSGIGYAAARLFASRGADILAINRSREKSETLCAELEKEFGAHCEFLLADLALLDDMHRTAQYLRDMNRPIDILIHNAGIYLDRRTLTSDGIETTFAVNYLSNFVMNYTLAERLRNEGQARIIMVGSEAYRFAAWGLHLEDINFDRRRYGGLKAYGAAKLAQILSMHQFHRLFEHSGVTINTMHPGMVATNTGRDNRPFYRWYKKNVIDKMSQTPDISAAALYYLGVSPEIDGVSDTFFNLTTPEETTPPACDRQAAEELWNISIELGRLA